jgi:phosphopantetheine--protein transferase-like protein
LPGTDLIRSVRKQFGIDVSITHCPELVAVATGKGKLGLDCEAPGKKRDWQGIADQFFTPEEANTIRQAGSKRLERVFLQHWTLKEAFIKANQKSIFGDLNRLTVSSAIEVQLKGHPQEYWQAYSAVVGNCMLGICHQPERSAPPVLLECTDLSCGSYISCVDTNSINFISAISLP